jgi:hypothetical protein
MSTISNPTAHSLKQKFKKNMFGISNGSSVGRSSKNPKTFQDSIKLDGKKLQRKQAKKPYLALVDEYLKATYGKLAQKVLETTT